VAQDRVCTLCPFLLIRTVSAASCSLPLSESEQIEKLKKQLQWAELKMRILEERLCLQVESQVWACQREAERRGQMQLLELESGVSDSEVQAEGEREQVSLSPPVRLKRKHAGRQELPAHLPRVE